MNAFCLLIRRALQARPLAMVFAPIVGALAVVVLFSALGTAPVAAQGPTGCFEQMSDGASPIAVEFVSTTYTVTLMAGQDVCIESAFDLLLGFVDSAPFAINGEGASAIPAPGSGFLYPQGPISGTLKYDITSANATKLVLTDVNGAGGSVMVWLGTLKSTLAALTAPVPVATAQNLIVVGPGPLKKGPAPKWEFSPLKGDMSLKITAGVIFTATTNNQIWPAEVCGTDCFEVAVSTSDGMIEATALKGWWWTATLVGAAEARVMMPAPVTTSPASVAGKTNVWKNAGGSYFLTANCTGAVVVFDPAVHNLVETCGGARGKIAGAPTRASRHYLPLLLKP
jgi:hypothetical protein